MGERRLASAGKGWARRTQKRSRMRSPSGSGSLRKLRRRSNWSGSAVHHREVRGRGKRE